MQEEDYFILAVIRHRFGFKPAQIAQALLNNANQTIEKLITSTNLSHEIVAASLTALLQHDIVMCQGPHEVLRPQKVMAARGRGPRRPDTTATPEHFHTYDVSTTLTPFGDVNTRLYGNVAAGYVEEGAEPTNYINQSILPLIKFEYDQATLASRGILNYQYSINRGMVRGLSRTPFYSGLVQELIHSDAKLVIDEFIFRGKITLAKALEYVVERLMCEDDSARRLSHKNQDGTDPLYTDEEYNAMSRAQLEQLSVFSFNQARFSAVRYFHEQYGPITSNAIPDLTKASHIGRISSRILREMDEIELERYEGLVPRAVGAFEQVNNLFLLVESPGFMDPQTVSDATMLFPTSLPPVTQPLDGVTPASVLEKSLTLDQQDDLNRIGGVIQEELKNKKRKAVEIIAPSIQTPSAPVSMREFEEEDLFDPEPTSGSSIKRQRMPSSASNSFNSSSSFQNNNNTDSIQLSAYQSPLSRENRLYILNHDRFTLLLRGEIFHDFITSKIGITAGILIASLSYDSLRFENPSLNGVEYTIPMMKRAVMDYIQLRKKSYNPHFFSPAALESIQQQQHQQQSNQTIPNTPSTHSILGTQQTPQPRGQPNPSTANNIHGDYISGLNAVQHLSVKPITTKQLKMALLRLSREDLPGTANIELKFVSSVVPSNSTFAQTRSVRQNSYQEQRLGNMLSTADVDDNDDDVVNIAYCVHYHKIAQAVRREYLMTHLYTRFGSPGRRVIGTLLDHSRLEEKQISDFSLVPKREVKEILHLCLKDGIVNLLDVPTSSDRLNPSKVFYLWGMDYSLSGDRFLATFYKSFANALLRLDVQRDQSTQFIDKMLLHRHMDMAENEAHAGRDFKLLFARFMHVMNGTMKAIVVFKDLCPK